MKLYRVQNINCPLDHDSHYLRGRVARELGVGPGHLLHFTIERRSVDARDKHDIRLVYTVVAGLETPSRSLGSKATPLTPVPAYRFPAPFPRGTPGDGRRPLIVGSGPAGLFCALYLARAGYRPLVLERGDDVETRAKALTSFWNGGELDPDSNAQFGEGGAGSFSDGKLTSSAGDDSGRARAVLEDLAAAGAPGSILYDGKPHIGTDYLVRLVRRLRGIIEEHGGTVRFRARVSALTFDRGRVKGVRLADGERIDSETVVLAIGHSARDTFTWLAASGVAMEPKAFAMGLRIEHPQEMISRAQYGDAWNHPALGAADYKLTQRAPDGRGVYSFCMCPGGYVVDASSEPGLSATNGMSDFARNSPNANSAIVVSVRPEDYGDADVLAGMQYQRRWESLAWEAARAASGAPAGRSAIPVQTLADFMAGRPSTRLGAVVPAIRGTFAPADLNACLPSFVADGIKDAFASFDRRIGGFGRPDAVLSGVETRTSSPVRILRDQGLQSGLRGLFPCGEGAGYAGGIMSAAVDGIRVAEAVAASTLSIFPAGPF